MDSGVRAMVEAVDEARRQLRENALPKARESGRDKVPEGEEAALLRALAELVESAGELVGVMAEQMTTNATCRTYAVAGRRLRDEANNLRGDEKLAAERVK